MEFSYAPTKRDLVRLVRRASRRSLVSFLVFGIVMAVVGLLAVSDDDGIQVNTPVSRVWYA